MKDNISELVSHCVINKKIVKTLFVNRYTCKYCNLKDICILDKKINPVDLVKRFSKILNG